MKITRDIIVDNYNRKVAPYLQEIDNNGCILNSNVTTHRPYGHIALTSPIRSTSYTKGHALSYLYHNNIVSTNGLHVLHRCDNPACCNPDHLWLGTNADNVKDKLSKNRGHNFNGTRHPRASLTEKEVLAIYISKEPRQVLADRYNIKGSIIYQIRKKFTWLQVTNAFDELMV